MNKKDILIVSALEVETQGQLEDYRVLYTGVGKVNATLELTKVLQKAHLHYLPPMPKLVINYGTAGSRKIKKGQLVDCTKFIERDMDVTGLGFMRGETPFENDIPSELDFSNKPFNPDYGREHHINTIKKHYTCGTGDNFVDNIEDEIEYVDVFDMEAYALAKVCYHYVIPFISFKYITDNANESSPKDWEDNLGDGIVEFKERILKEFGNE